MTTSLVGGAERRLPPPSRPSLVIVVAFAALVSRPKQLAADVARAAATSSIGDELAQLRSLKEKKEELKQSVAAESGAPTPRLNAADEITSGRVAESRSRIAAATADDDEAEEDAAAEERRRDLAAIRDSAAAIKDRWLKGDVEGAEAADASAKNDELDELRRGPRVADRFKEGGANEASARNYERTATDLEEIKKGSKFARIVRSTSGSLSAQQRFLPPSRKSTMFARRSIGILARF